MASPADRSELLALTAEIVAAHVSNNKLEAGELPALIRQVYGTLAGIGMEPAELVAGGAADRPAPAVPVKKSVTPDYIVCLEDGKKLKMLKRYLRSKYDMSPDDNPIIDAVPGIEGLYVICGSSGHGFKMGPAVGEAAADWVMGHRPALLDAFRLARFTLS